MPVCTNCAAYVECVYTQYSENSIRLEQCVNVDFGQINELCSLTKEEQGSCHQFADPYAEKDALNITLDLILLKGVLLHLLYNRGTSPRRVDKDGNIHPPDVVKESEVGEKVCRSNDPPTHFILFLGYRTEG